MDWKRARKALVAGLGATLTGVATAAVEGHAPSTTEGWIGLVAGSLAAGLVTGAAAYAVRNAGSDIGPTGSTTTPGGTVV